MGPQGRPIGMVRRNPHAAMATSQILVWLFSSVIALAALAALALAIHNIVVFKQHHDDRNKHTKSVGFSAFKNTTQDVVDGVAADVIEWEVGGGYPSYDNTKGGFNATSGVFTVRKEGIYNAIATVCYNASDSAGALEVHLVTSGAEELVAVSRMYAVSGATGEDCVTVSQNQWLVEDAEVSVMALTETTEDEVVVEGTLFSVERVAKYDP